MNTAYIVIYRDYDITKIYGVFTDRAAAERYAEHYTVPEDSYGFDAKGPDDLYIEEYELNPTN